MIKGNGHSLIIESTRYGAITLESNDLEHAASADSILIIISITGEASNMHFYKFFQLIKIGNEMI